MRKESILVILERAVGGAANRYTVAALASALVLSIAAQGAINSIITESLAERRVGIPASPDKLYSPTMLASDFRSAWGTGDSVPRSHIAISEWLAIGRKSSAPCADRPDAFNFYGPVGELNLKFLASYFWLGMARTALLFGFLAAAMVGISGRTGTRFGMRNSVVLFLGATIGILKFAAPIHLAKGLLNADCQDAVSTQSVSSLARVLDFALPIANVLEIFAILWLSYALLEDIWRYGTRSPKRGQMLWETLKLFWPQLLFVIIAWVALNTDQSLDAIRRWPTDWMAPLIAFVSATIFYLTLSLWGHGRLRQSAPLATQDSPGVAPLQFSSDIILAITVSTLFLAIGIAMLRAAIPMAYVNYGSPWGTVALPAAFSFVGIPLAMLILPWWQARFPRRRESDRIVLIAIILVLAVAVVCLRTFMVRLPQIVGAVALVFLFLSSLALFVWGILQAIHRSGKHAVPGPRRLLFRLVLASLTVTFLWSTFRDHSLLEPADSASEADPMLYEDYVKRWVKNCLDHCKRDSNNRIPLVFVSASGGGIRSAFWTASVLHRIVTESASIGLANIFVISGASGGSLGALAFVASQEGPQPAAAPNPFVRIFRDDYLAPVLSWLFFAEIPGLFIPGARPVFKRDVAFEEALVESWREICKEDREKCGISQEFTALWKRRTDLPLVIANAVESGAAKRINISILKGGGGGRALSVLARTIIVYNRLVDEKTRLRENTVTVETLARSLPTISEEKSFAAASKDLLVALGKCKPNWTPDCDNNLNQILRSLRGGLEKQLQDFDLSPNTARGGPFTFVPAKEQVLKSWESYNNPDIFVNTEDFFSYWSRDISVVRAAHFSARFPYVSPSGAVKPSKGSLRLIVDGGYFDNSGAQANLELFRAQGGTQLRCNSANWRQDGCGTGATLFVPYYVQIDNDYDQSYLLSRELPDPNEVSIPVRTVLKTMDYNAQSAKDQARFQFGSNYCNISMPRSALKAPLGWVLSQASIEAMDRQSRDVIQEATKDKCPFLNVPPVPD